MLIHCTMEELNAVRDGEGTQAALRHVDDCQECRDELDALHQRIAALRALPTTSAPRDRWGAVRNQIVAERRRRRWSRVGIGSLVAAGMTVLSFGVGQLVKMQQDPDPYEILVQEAESLEHQLQIYRPEIRVMNGRVASAVALLEDRLSDVDERIARVRVVEIPRDDAIELLRRRVQLMDALIQVHQSNSVYRGF